MAGNESQSLSIASSSSSPQPSSSSLAVNRCELIEQLKIEVTTKKEPANPTCLEPYHGKQLAVETVEKIVSYMTLNDAVQARLVCKTWRDLIDKSFLGVKPTTRNKEVVRSWLHRHDYFGPTFGAYSTDMEILPEECHPHIFEHSCAREQSDKTLFLRDSHVSGLFSETRLLRKNGDGQEMETKVKALLNGQPRADWTRPQSCWSLFTSKGFEKDFWYDLHTGDRTHVKGFPRHYRVTGDLVTSLNINSPGFVDLYALHPTAPEEHPLRHICKLVTRPADGTQRCLRDLSCPCRELFLTGREEGVETVEYFHICFLDSVLHVHTFDVATPGKTVALEEHTSRKAIAYVQTPFLIFDILYFLCDRTVVFTLIGDQVSSPDKLHVFDVEHERVADFDYRFWASPELVETDSGKLIMMGRTEGTESFVTVVSADKGNFVRTHLRLDVTLEPVLKRGSTFELLSGSSVLTVKYEKEEQGGGKRVFGLNVDIEPLLEQHKKSQGSDFVMDLADMKDWRRVGYHCPKDFRTVEGLDRFLVTAGKGMAKVLCFKSRPKSMQSASYSGGEKMFDERQTPYHDTMSFFSRRKTIGSESGDSFGLPPLPNPFL